MPIAVPPFPRATGDAADAIRARDWRGTPLGEPAQWPAALRCALELMLNSPESMYLVWGPELVFFHNDAYAPILGPRLHGAIGQPLRVLWADAWSAVEEPIGKAFAGGNSRYENAHVVMSRFGEPEDTWWTFSFSPLFEQDGAVGGAFCVTKEVTRMVVAQERLARENERLIALFDKSPMFMAFLHGPQHRVELLNAGYSDLIGNREVLGQRIVDALPEVVDQGYLPLLDEVYRTGVPYIGRRVAYAPLGSDSVAAPDHLLDVVFQPVRDEAGQVTGVFVQGLDITPQEELQRHLVQAESRHRQILDSARDYAIIATDLHGRITLWNEGAHAMTGWREADMLGHGPERLFPANERDTMQRYLSGAVRDGGISGENWYQRRNGEAFWAQGAITVLHDEEGAAAGFVAVLRDRTTERQAREALESSERRLGALVSATAQRVYAMSANWQEMRLILRDGATAHLLAPDMDWRTAFVHAEDQGRLNLAIAHAIAARQPLVIEHRAPGPGDTPAWTQTRAVPLLDEQGNIIEWFGTATDVSQRRNAETQLRQLTATLEERVRERSEDLLLAEEKLRQSQKMEAVGQLTGGIAHDFNNMLTAVSMGLELLELRLRQGSTEGLERYLEMARSGTDRATALTQRLLAFSRRQTLAPSVVDPDVLIASLQDIIARSLGPSIALRTELHGDGAHVQVDAPQLENALLNLCINARDAMPDGGRLLIRTRVETLDTEHARSLDLPAGSYMALSVGDTGTGMAPDIVQKVFEPFFTTKPIGQGTGLGLSMIYGFTRQSGGHVQVESRPGTGTTMTLYLPRFLGDVQTEVAAPADMADHAAVPAGLHVLVVEDEAAIRSMVVEVLGEAGYHVQQVADGSAALDLLRGPGLFDVLVTDVGLAGSLNGRQLADAARQTRPQLPVLFVTGYAGFAAVGAGQLDAGMQILTKPFTAAELLARLRGLGEPGATNDPEPPLSTEVLAG